MRVTPEMTTEGGQSLADMADFLDNDSAGIHAIVVQDNVALTLDSTAWPCTVSYMDPDTADALGDLLKQRAAEARAQR